MHIAKDQAPAADMLQFMPFFKAFCNPIRAQIIEFLLSGERCVCEMTGPLDQSQPLVSHHLALLRDAGLLRLRNRGHAHLLLHRLGALRRRSRRLPRLRRAPAQRPTYPERRRQRLRHRRQAAGAKSRLVTKPRRSVT